MSLFKNLLNIYNANASEVGKVYYRKNGGEYMLLPPSHTTQKAHLEVHITLDGKFGHAQFIEGDSNTVIPITHLTLKKTSNIVPNPLHDKLVYVSKDFKEYSDSLKPKYYDAPQLYLEQLKKWQDSEFATDEIRACYQYLNTGTLTKDLIEQGFFPVDEDGMLIESWKGKDKPPIFKLVTHIKDVFIRFTIEGSNVPIWQDQTLWQKHHEHVLSIIEEYDICYVTGEYVPVADKHPAKIRNTADMAKIISSQSPSLIFQGRFSEANGTYMMGYEVSQKVHNVLKWLINHRSFSINGRTFIVWDDKAQELPYIYANDAAKSFKKQLKNESNEVQSMVNLLIIDSAAENQGRLAVLNYLSLPRTHYLQNSSFFFNSMNWEIPYFIEKERKWKTAPTLFEVLKTIIDVNKTADSIVKETYTQLFLLALHNKEIPKEYIHRAVERTTKRNNFNNAFDWEEQLAITCALINHINRNEEYSVILDTNRTERDYLFGRLLAIAQVLESGALPPTEKRLTNAERYMVEFSIRPARTWQTLQHALIPYEKKLGSKLTNYYQNKIEEIFTLMDEKDFSNDKLSPTYLLGYYSQRKDLFTKKSINTTTDMEPEELIYE